MSIWTPLESNPEVLTKYIHKLGVSPSWSVIDVIGLDDELLAMLPMPVKALVLLFPISQKYEEFCAEEKKRIMAGAEPEKHPEDLFYMRQFTHNACGTVALIHSVANNKDIDIADGVLKSFLDNGLALSPEERGHALEKDKAFTEDHQKLALEGQTDAAAYEKVIHHFIALVNKEDTLYELDGRKSYPVSHGKTSAETFVRDAAKVCKEFMARDPDELRFTVLALAATEA
ncbi:ubiquitin carboxyl-terminal hydrolase [Drosophila grimshawi]|uniref:Ubiquitin carboxyl-terminal hydrolase n=1 Tax=Drosophila grimshawi TaxID=7222 RepID=B4JAQ1_DROGR|nr:ubiquitin carboxyl-terminal hydrolase [Drosophila grimshawi]EDW03859.1 GH11470 [Drosophila grimshawi]